MAVEPIPTVNILTRTFNIRYAGGTGTMFEADHGAGTVLITALHVVEGIQPNDTIEIAANAMWDSLPVSLIGSVGDVCVLRCGRRLGPAHLPIALSSNGLQLGQHVSFLGFPLHLPPSHYGEEKEGGFPLPFVKRAAVSRFGSKD